MTNSTIVGNDGGARATNGGGLRAAQGTISVENSIVADNTVDNPTTGTASNCGTGGTSSGAITSLGHNLDSGTDCGFTAAGDIQGTDPNLISSNPQNLAAMSMCSPSARTVLQSTRFRRAHPTAAHPPTEHR